jgi:hypothetical protein
MIDGTLSLIMNLRKANRVKADFLRNGAAFGLPYHILHSSSFLIRSRDLASRADVSAHNNDGTFSDCLKRGVALLLT